MRPQEVLLVLRYYLLECLLSLLSWHVSPGILGRPIQELHRHITNDIAPSASATAVPLQCMCTGQAAKPGRDLHENIQNHMTLSALRRRPNDADFSGLLKGRSGQHTVMFAKPDHRFGSAQAALSKLRTAKPDHLDAK